MTFEVADGKGDMPNIPSNGASDLHRLHLNGIVIETCED